MLNVVVGVALTALLGGLLVPYVKGRIDRRTERYASSVELVDALAASLWTYWKSAVRVAFYGEKGPAAELERALQRWDDDSSWKLGCDIQIQISRSRRLLPDPAMHEQLDQAQLELVAFLDQEIERLRSDGTREDWAELRRTLMKDKRDAVESILTGVTHDLRLGHRT
jgi:hypothetical protein